MNKSVLVSVPVLSLGLMAAAGQDLAADADGSMLLYIGRSSVKIRTADGFVLYIDPYAPGDYSEPADLILVTHGHADHNNTSLCARAKNCAVVAPRGAVEERGATAVAEGDSIRMGPVTIHALPASNKNHRRGECLGYLIEFDGIKVYHAGDTSWLPEMAGFASYRIDYVMLPCDGFYNMDPVEAEKCAAAIKARCVIPMHSNKDGVFGAANAAELAKLAAQAGMKGLVMRPGDKIILNK